jgi:ribose transport system ATP-binding protein
MKILSGEYQDYEGRIIFDDKPLAFSNPKEAQEAGIAIIHQELNLIPHLSITENIFLGRELTNRWGMLDKTAMRQKTESLLQRLRLKVDPNTLIYELKVGQQQVVEIAKALLLDSEVIIMDEPTSAISDSEVEILFGIIEDLRKENKAIVYISHKLDELFRMADRFIVLRDGRSIESGDMKGMKHDDIIRKMVGRDIKVIRQQTVKPKQDAILTVKNVYLKHPERTKEFFLKDICFSLGRGEILGIFGLMGAGRTELLETIFGLHPVLSSGDISINQKTLKCKTPADAIRHGMALVPEDRKKDGAVLGLDVKTNIGLTTLKNMEKFGIISDKQETALARKYMADLKIKTSSDKQLVKNLSGGNQQKVVLSKWMAIKPKILMLDEPTRGIDINAKTEIYKLILDLADAGLGVIVVSSELPEILAISDRILVMAEGCITAEFPVQEATENIILKAAIPASI